MICNLETWIQMPLVKGVSDYPRVFLDDNLSPPKKTHNEPRKSLLIYRYPTISYFNISTEEHLWYRDIFTRWKSITFCNYNWFWKFFPKQLAMGIIYHRAFLECFIELVIAFKFFPQIFMTWKTIHFFVCLFSGPFIVIQFHFNSSII